MRECKVISSIQIKQETIFSFLSEQLFVSLSITGLVLSLLLFVITNDRMILVRNMVVKIPFWFKTCISLLSFSFLLQAVLCTAVLLHKQLTPFYYMIFVTKDLAILTMVAGMFYAYKKNCKDCKLVQDPD